MEKEARAAGCPGRADPMSEACRSRGGGRRERGRRSDVREVDVVVDVVWYAAREWSARWCRVRQLVRSPILLRSGDHVPRERLGVVGRAGQRWPLGTARGGIRPDSGAGCSTRGGEMFARGNIHGEGDRNACEGDRTNGGGGLEHGRHQREKKGSRWSSTCQRGAHSEANLRSGLSTVARTRSVLRVRLGDLECCAARAP